jgi:hypothetical protein
MVRIMTREAEILCVKKKKKKESKGKTVGAEK